MANYTVTIFFYDGTNHSAICAADAIIEYIGIFAQNVIDYVTIKQVPE